MSIDSLKVGVIGAGHLGQVHARIYNQMDEFDLVGIVDTDENTATRVAGEYSCLALVEPASLIGSVDAVSIAVPTTSHYEVAIPYLEAGIPILLEKPIAETVPQAEKLVALAEQKSIPLLVGHLERFNPALAELRSRIRSPAYIEVHRAGPFVKRAAGVDVVTDLMIHDLDIVSSLLNEQPDAILAIGETIVTERTDLANARLEYPCGVVANMTASRVSRDRKRTMRVYGESGYLEIDYETQQLVVAECRNPVSGDQLQQLEYSTITPLKTQPLEAEITHFYQVVQKGVPPMVSGEQGLMALRQVEKINTVISAANN